MAAARPWKIGIVGVGKIARDQHLPTIAVSPHFELAATASRFANIGGVDSFEGIEALLQARPDISCLAICTPPQVRYAIARQAILAGRHVMLEKPPGATISEVEDLVGLARQAGVALQATWHSRYAHGVTAARDWLAGKTIRKLRIIWKEDVRRWHPGQEWLWQAGGQGIFDPGINALSVLTAIYPRRVHLTAATLFFPENRETPIAADLTFFDPGGAEMAAEFDFRQEGPQSWDIHVETDEGSMTLSQGGAVLSIDGQVVASGPDREYAGLYARFAELVATGAIDVDLAPMLHVADAFTLGRRINVAPFHY